jgi:hypothetical protein
MNLKQFTTFINAIDTFHKREEQFNIAFETFNSSYTMMEFCPEITNSIFDFIKEDFDDEDELFSYWFYDLEQGTKWTEDLCNEADGSVIKIQTIEDIFLYLTKNKKGKNNE